MFPSASTAQPQGIGFSSRRAISILPQATVLVARSTTIGRSRPAGMATAIGAVLRYGSRAKVGITSGVALVIATPHSPSSSAIMA